MRKVLAGPRRRGAMLPVLFAALMVIARVPAVGAEPLTLDQCVRLSLRHNVSVAQSEAQLRSAEADRLGAFGRFLPTARVSGTWTDPERPVFSTERGDFFDTSYRASFQAGLTLFDGMGNVAGWNRTGHGREAAREGLRKARQDVVLETERRFFEVGRNEALLDVQREAVRLSAEQLKKTRAMKDLGAATQADVYKADVDHANNRLSELRSERDLELSMARLGAYLGLDPRDRIVIAAEDLAVPAGVDGADAASRALEVHPGLLSATADFAAGRSGVTEAKSTRYPSFTLFYSSNWFNVELQDFDDEHIEWSYGAQVSLDLFDGFATKARIRRAEATALSSRRVVESTRRDVLLGVRQAELDLEIARRSIEVAEGAVRSSEEDLRLAQERYKIGEGTILDVIDAQVNLTRSKTDLVSASHDARLSASALRNAIGDMPLPEPAE